MDFVNYQKIKGMDVMQIPCICGFGTPGSHTAGGMGSLYMERSTGTIYKCRSSEDGAQVWEPLVEEKEDAGLSADASALLVKILAAGSYTEDQTDNIASLKEKLGIRTYLVEFYVNGTWICDVFVDHGGSAQAPADPEVEGMTFIGWDQEFEYVTKDMVVNAVFD